MDDVGSLPQTYVAITDDKLRVFFFQDVLCCGFYSYMIFIDISTTFHSLNGHDSGTD